MIPKSLLPLRISWNIVKLHQPKCQCVMWNSGTSKGVHGVARSCLNLLPPQRGRRNALIISLAKNSAPSVENKPSNRRDKLFLHWEVAHTSRKGPLFNRNTWRQRPYNYFAGPFVSNVISQKISGFQINIVLSNRSNVGWKSTYNVLRTCYIIFGNYVAFFREKSWLIKTAVKRWETCWKILRRKNAGKNRSSF